MIVAMRDFPLDAFASELDDVASPDQLEAFLGRAATRLGFDHFALTLEIGSSPDASSSLLLHDYRKLGRNSIPSSTLPAAIRFDAPATRR